MYKEIMKKLAEIYNSCTPHIACIDCEKTCDKDTYDKCKKRLKGIKNGN